MARISRFDCASFSLTLKGLLRKTKRVIWICFGLGVVVHLSLMQIGGSETRHEVTKPLTTRFIKRQPRLSKPLELRKRPRPKQRTMQRKVVSVKPKADRQEEVSGLHPFQGLQRLARPGVQLRRPVTSSTEFLEPQAMAQAIEGTKEGKHTLDMALEMLDVEALDTGRYHAIVIQDPSDKRNIRGFLRLRFAYSTTMAKPDFRDQLDRLVHGTIAVIEAMNQYTDIRASFEGRILFASREMLKTPWAFSFIAENLVFPEEELSSLGTYLTSGGFMLWDVWSRVKHPQGIGHRRPAIAITSAHSNLEQAMDTQGLKYGRDWTFEMLSNAHPIYHCFFDFDGIPAGRWDEEFSFADRLEGLHFDGRWPLVICQKGLLHLWSDPLNPQDRSERLIQFGINTIVFALTQEGSVTQQLMGGMD